MKRTLTIWILLLGIFVTSYSQSILVGDSAEISLITCSPGPVAYEKFGHTALRYHDPATGMDVVFNYGIFDFDEPGFYSKFVKGETYYKLGVYDTQLFLPQYAERNSQVTEQILNLTKEEKQKLLDALFVNYLPENRDYLYNFVFDNCATRPRDKVLELFRGNRIQYKLPEDNRTFREWVAAYTGERSWLMFGIDLVFGKDADKKVMRWDTMFLPEVLSKELGEVDIVENDSITRPLIKSKSILVPAIEKVEKSNLLKYPLFATSLLFVIGLFFTIYEFRNKKHFKILDFILLLVTGIAGLIIFYLMFFSIHPLVKMNVNILWCNPLNIIIALLLWSRKASKAVLIFQIINVILFMMVLVVGTMALQILNIAFVPVIILLIVRSFWWLQRNWKILKPSSSF